MSGQRRDYAHGQGSYIVRAIIREMKDKDSNSFSA